MDAMDEMRGPQVVWYLHGIERFKKYKLFIHACVDGYSHKFMHLKCFTNDDAFAALKIFYKSTLQFGLPRFVTMDREGEASKIAEFLEENVDPYCVLPPRTVHNTSTERLWRGVEDIIRPFEELFVDLELCGMLDATNHIHLFALHYVFLPRMQASLDTFAATWDSHSRRAHKNKSPNELYSIVEPLPQYAMIHPPDSEPEEAERRRTEELIEFASSVAANSLQVDGSMGVNVYKYLVQEVVVFLSKKP